MGSNGGIIEHTYERAVERMAELEAQCDRLITRNEGLAAKVEALEVLNDRLTRSARDSEGKAAGFRRVAETRLQTIHDLLLGVRRVGTYDASHSIALLVSAARSLEENTKDRAQVQLARDSDDRVNGVNLGVLEWTSLNPESALRAAGDALVERIPKDGYGSAEQYEKVQEKP